MKVYLAVKVSYGNFDCPIEDPVAAGNKDAIETEITKLNAERSKKEIAEEVEYIKKCVRWIG